MYLKTIVCISDQAFCNNFTQESTEENIIEEERGRISANIKNVKGKDNETKTKE